MIITIEAPSVESQLQQEATRRGLSVNEYARQLLELHLEAPLPISSSEEAVSTEAVSGFSSFFEWRNAFDAWIQSHPTRKPLPEEAFDRASFYTEAL